MNFGRSMKDNMKNGTKKFFLAALFLCSVKFGYGQEAVFNSIGQKFDAYRTQALQEKLYVHVDRSFYQTGETMWFTIYAVDGTTHRPLDISAVAYLEITDLINHSLLQTKIELKAGEGHGSLLLPSSLSSGNYRVRAYTRWMKNFDPDFYFQQPISILNTLRKPEVESAPVVAAIDVQFFPEGGSLVKGLKSKIAFRATDKDGHGIAFRGAVITAGNDTVVRFNPSKFGIGNFAFTPGEAQTYRAVIKDASGKVTQHAMPVVVDLGYSINLTDSAAWIRLTTTAKLSESTVGVVYLLVHARNQLAVSVAGRLVQGKIIFPIDKRLLGDGINHFTLFNADGKPVCERLYFKRPENKLTVAVKSDKPEYEKRRKIVLTGDARPTSGAPLATLLSLSVYRKDSLQTIQPATIGQYLWLTSELRGTIDSPGYYFNNAGVEEDQAMDNLMLTHGWSRFTWNDVLNKPIPRYSFVPEPRGFLVTGKVINVISNAPAPDVKTYLAIPGKNIRLYAARSDQQGQVMFQMKDFFGMNKLVMQTDTQVDSIYKFEIDDPFSKQFSTTKLPPFTIAPGFKNKILSRSIRSQAQSVFYADSARFVKTSFDTIAFYGKPYKQYFLDSYTRFTSMEDVMREYVAGLWVRKKNGSLHFWVLDELSNSMFRDNSMVLLDGVPVFQEEKILAYDPLKVEKLEIVARKYFLGPAVFNGIVSYTSATGDLANYPLDSRSLVQNYEGLQRQREFYAPRYETPASRNGRLPDFRDLLFWAPEVKPDANGKFAVEFYTSDQTGSYEVVIQGLTKDGLPGTGNTAFDVHDVSN
jgi:hypothetical protein